MRIEDVEIPWEHERGFWYRFFEILPGLLTYSIIIIPIILSFFSPIAAAFYLIAYIFVWFIKAIAFSRRVLQGYGRIKAAQALDWEMVLDDLKQPKEAIDKYQDTKDKMLKIHRTNLNHIFERNEKDPKPEDIIHAVVIATYNESPDIIHPTVESVIKAKVDNQQNVAFFLAYEARSGPEKEKQSKETVKKYSKHFIHSEAVKHEVTPDEVKGKGGNATFTGRRIAEWAKENNIDPSKVLVTVLDADNRPDVHFFAALTYSYIVADDRKKRSYQPTAVYVNNVWDAPAIMRLSAFNNSFFHIANSMRLHALRNFSAHTQSLDALVDSNFWSVRTIVEDGHQFWRMYFVYDGEHEVVPIHAPVYQDAVYADGYRRTIVAQFKQIRRWTYGATDVAYMATRAFQIKNKVPKWDALFKFSRLLEGHVIWATSSLLLFGAGWIPLLVNAEAERSIVALQLPTIMARINLIGMIVIFIAMYISFATLPPRPEHYPKRRYVSFFLGWLLIPIVGVFFNSMAAIYTQTRLMFGRYFGDFDVTEKAVKKT